MFSAIKQLRRLPVVRQYDQIDCGPAALLSILRYHGGDSSIVHVRDLADTDARGCTLLGLLRAAEALGFSARGAAGEYDELRAEKLPCIAHVILGTLQHFVVVYEMRADSVLIGDPGTGSTRRVARAEFEAMWKTRSVLLLEPGPNLMHARPPHWTRWILAHCKRDETWVYQAIFIGVVYTILSLSTAVFVQWLVDRFIPGRDMQRIIIAGALLIAIQLVKAGAGYFRQRFLVELNRRIGARMTTDFLTHLFKLPIRFFESRKTGDITARMNDSIKIQNALLTVVGSALIDAFILVGSIASIFIIAPSIGWLALATLPLYGVFMYFGTRSLPTEQRDVMKGYAALESSYIDSLGGLDDILGYNAASAFTQRNVGLYQEYQNAAARLGMRQARLWVRAEAVGGALILVSLIISALLVLDGAMQLGEMMAAYALLAGALPSIHRLVEANVSLHGASVAASRLLDLMLVEPERNIGEQSFELRSSLKVSDLSFTWPRGQRLLELVSMELPVGRVTGLWGPSGSGKTTLVRLLQRKYAPASGSITIDNLPVERIDLRSYRRNVAVVSESVKIFSGTLADNILLGRTYASPEEFHQRLMATGVTGFLARFEHGLATIVGEEGRRLSSGERQLIGLLRALLDEPAVLIMDEGVNAIDVRIVADIMTVLRNYASSGHAVMLISHNPLTLLQADYLYALENGRIVQQSAPATLLGRGGALGDLFITADAATLIGV